MLEDQIAAVNAILASLPARRATRMEVGPGVFAALPLGAAPTPGPQPWAPSLSVLLGVPVVDNADLDVGQWRMLDQHGDQLGAGRLAGTCWICHGTITWDPDDPTGQQPHWRHDDQAASWRVGAHRAAPALRSEQ